MAQRGVNKVILVGNLGEVPEIRYGQSGEMIAGFSLATSDIWVDKNSGQKQEKTEWHRVSAFGAVAEIVAKYLTKGTKVYVEGQLRTKKWTDQQGVERYTTQVHMRELQILKDGIQVANEEGAPQQYNAPPPQGQPSAQAQPPGQYYQRGTGPQPQTGRNPNGTQTSPYAQNAPTASFTPTQDPDPYGDGIPF